MDELELWTASLRGDERAFAQLFDGHQGRVVNHAIHLVGNRHDAEDVAAAAFLELWRLRRKVRIVNGSVLPWLLVTTTNISRNQSRAIRRYDRLLRSLPRAREESADVADLVEDPRAIASVRALKVALGAMTPKDAALLALTALDGMSTADAARAVGISPSTARVRLHRAKTKARQTLHMTEVIP